MHFIVNSNGDAIDDLRKRHVAMAEAARAYEASIRALYPHGRNYQSYGAEGESYRIKDVAVFDAALFQLQAIQRDLIQAHEDQLMENDD